MQPQDPQNPLTPPEQPPAPPVNPTPPTVPEAPEAPSVEPAVAPEAPAAADVQVAPDANAVPGGFTPPAAPVVSAPEQPAPAVNDTTVLSYNSVHNKRKSPLVPIIVSLVVLIVLVAGSIFGVMLAANSSASSYKSTLAKQWNDNHDAIANGDSSSVSGLQDVDKIFTKVMNEKPHLVSLPFAAQLSSDYKKMQDVDKEVTSYYKTGQAFLEDVIASGQYNDIVTVVGDNNSSDPAVFAAALNTAANKMKALKTNAPEVKQMIKLASQFYEKLASDLKANDEAQFSDDFSQLGGAVTEAETTVGNSFTARSDDLSKTRDDIAKKIGVKEGLGSQHTDSGSTASDTVKL